MARLLAIAPDRGLAEALDAGLDGHEWLACGGNLEALRRVRDAAIDVVITDPLTTVDDDLGFADELRNVRPGVRLIVLAPATTRTDVVAALRAKVFACFTAPFDYRDIAGMARSALDADHWQHGIEVVSGLPHWMTLRVSCHRLTAERLIQFMTEWERTLPELERDRLITAFREMLVNAMEHGAGFDPDKVIEVTAARTKRAIVYHFRDPGRGFDRADLAHAAKTADVEDLIETATERDRTGRRSGGFGMLIVRQIADELVYNERGNEVLLIKHLR